MDWSTLTPVFTFILGLLSKILYDLWHEKRQEKNKQQIQGLKRHYEDFNKTVSSIERQLLHTFNDSGQIITVVKEGIGDSGPHPSEDLSWPFFKGGDDPEFVSHFKAEANDCDTVIDMMYQHNRKVENFDRGLMDKINIALGSGTTSSDLYYEPVVAYETVRIIRKDIYQLVEEKIKMTKNNPLLNRPLGNMLIKTLKTPNNHITIMISGVSVVELQDTSLVTKYLEALFEAFNSISLLEDMKTILTEAKNIESKAHNVGKRFRMIRRQYLEFGKTLKRKNDCPTCKLIFEE